ncbi:MAG: DUF4058 family protein [Cyanobacteria bacterium P01_H01_bin.35]
MEGLRSIPERIAISGVRRDCFLSSIGTTIQPDSILNQNIEHDYCILVSPSNQRPQAYLYTVNIQDMIPVFTLPLLPEDSEIILDLQSILHQVYEEGRYDLIIDYQQKIIPALSKTHTIWAENILKNKD